MLEISPVHLVPTLSVSIRLARTVPLAKSDWSSGERLGSREETTTRRTEATEEKVQTVESMTMQSWMLWSD